MSRFARKLRSSCRKWLQRRRKAKRLAFTRAHLSEPLEGREMPGSLLPLPLTAVLDWLSDNESLSDSPLEADITAQGKAKLAAAPAPESTRADVPLEAPLFDNNSDIRLDGIAIQQEGVMLQRITTTTFELNADAHVADSSPQFVLSAIPELESANSTDKPSPSTIGDSLSSSMGGSGTGGSQLSNQPADTGSVQGQNQGNDSRSNSSSRADSIQVPSSAVNSSASQQKPTGGDPPAENSSAQNSQATSGSDANKSNGNSSDSTNSNTASLSAQSVAASPSNSGRGDGGNNGNGDNSGAGAGASGDAQAGAATSDQPGPIAVVTPILHGVYPLSQRGAGQIYVRGELPIQARTGTPVTLEFFARHGKQDDLIGKTLVTKGPRESLVFSVVLDAKVPTGHQVFVRASGDFPGSGGVSALYDMRSATDSDRDGVPGEIEDFGPNNGDSNADGIPDRLQADVTSIPSSASGQFITLHGKGRGLKDTYGQRGKNGLSDSRVPHGIFEFVVEGVTPGAIANFSLTLPPDETIDTYYKIDPRSGELAPSLSPDTRGSGRGLRSPGSHSSGRQGWCPVSPSPRPDRRTSPPGEVNALPFLSHLKPKEVPLSMVALSSVFSTIKDGASCLHRSRAIVAHPGAAKAAVRNERRPKRSAWRRWTERR